MAEKHPITGDFSTHVGEASGLRALLYSSRPWLDTEAKQIVVGPSPVKTNRQGQFALDLPALEDLQFEIRATYSVPGLTERQSYESGWFYVTGPADLSDLAEEATDEADLPSRADQLQAAIDELQEAVDSGAGSIQFAYGTSLPDPTEHPNTLFLVIAEPEFD